MKLTKLIAILLALLMLAGLFAACGGEKPDETQPQATLPTMEGPQNTGSGYTAVPEPLVTEDPSAETGDGAPVGQTEPRTAEELSGEAGETGPDQLAPSEAHTDPTPPPATTPDPSQPASSEPAAEDSGEDLVVTEATEVLDETDEDLH